MWLIDLVVKINVSLVSVKSAKSIIGKEKLISYNYLKFKQIFDYNVK